MRRLLNPVRAARPQSHELGGRRLALAAPPHARLADKRGTRNGQSTEISRRLSPACHEDNRQLRIASQRRAGADSSADQLGASHVRRSRQTERDAGRADAGRAAASLGAARRRHMPRMRLGGQDAAAPSEHPPRSDRRAVSQAMEFADRPQANGPRLFQAALQPGQGTRPRPWHRPPRNRGGGWRSRTRAAAPAARPAAPARAGASRQKRSRRPVTGGACRFR